MLPPINYQLPIVENSPSIEIILDNHQCEITNDYYRNIFETKKFHLKPLKYVSHFNQYFLQCSLTHLEVGLLKHKYDVNNRAMLVELRNELIPIIGPMVSKYHLFQNYKRQINFKIKPPSTICPLALKVDKASEFIDKKYNLNHKVAKDLYLQNHKFCHSILEAIARLDRQSES